MITKIPKSFYDSNGNLKKPGVFFPVRDEMMYGDSVVVIKGNTCFSGIVHYFETKSVFIQQQRDSLVEQYVRYEVISLFCNNKKMRINRSNRNVRDGIFLESELGVHFSRVILFEKYKRSEFKTINDF